MRKKHEEAKHNGERWLLTYADLITLLMIFFVVLYTLSKVDAEKFRAVADSLNAAIGGGTPSKIELQKEPGASIISMNPATPSQSKSQNQSQKSDANSADAKSIQDIKKKIDSFIAANGLEARVETNIEERGLVVSIRDTFLFASGSADVSPEADAILTRLATILSGIPNFLRVEGHTDNAPIHTPQYASNWELSVARSLNVVKELIALNIPPEKLSATGYGEYRPVLPNTSISNMDKNRRVDLVIMRSEYDVTEPQNPAKPDSIVIAPILNN